MNSVLAILRERGFVAQTTDTQLGEILDKQPTTVYAGFDPTASSLHVGHLLPVMALAHFQRSGHKAIALFGGATGMIGDPSGRSDERNLQTPEAVAENLKRLKSQMSRILNFDGQNSAIMVDNNDWIGKMTFIDWLREVGKHFSIGYMLGKESVRGRMESESGISYTEFSYMTMQAYDFVHLFETYGCTLQFGGNDQWGNITAGIDLVRRKCGQQTYGLTLPLLTTATGEKFGKSAGNAVWLDPDLTSPYQFYQYWHATSDADVERMLKYFTFLPSDKIAEVCQHHFDQPEQRSAQKLLAEEVTRMIHGQQAADRAIAASDALFRGDLNSLKPSELNDIFSDVPSSELDSSTISEGVQAIQLLCDTGVCNSKGDARRAIEQGSIYLNNERVTSPDQLVTCADRLEGGMLILRRGKKNNHLVRIR